MSQKTAIIVGAGPAGLTAAYELVTKTDIKPIVYEMTGDIGGISKTVNYKGNLIDIGGHRFFSKSDRVMEWWKKILPLQGAPAKDDLILKRNLPLSNNPNAPDPEKDDRVMLVRGRISRIYFLKKFFDYPIFLTPKTLIDLGLTRTLKIGFSYLKSKVSPMKPEKSLENFFINRFGRELYRTFFKDYTEKVWGAPCQEIKPEWGEQRVKGLSITKALLHAFRNIPSNGSSLHQKKTETSLIQQFMYPKLGPGHLWEEVAKIVQNKGGEIHLNHRVIGIESCGTTIAGAQIKNCLTEETTIKQGDYFFSTMPVKELFQTFKKGVPNKLRQIADGLVYRDFIMTGLLLKQLSIKNTTKIKTINNIIPDNWIYVQEKDVKLGRIQIYNNWSPYLVKNENTVWIGLEYFCREGDELWRKPDKEFIEFAVDELTKIGFIAKSDVLDHIVLRAPKTYPAYFGAYDQFHKLRDYTDKFENLFLIGRNGMHRYNNTDHSMLTAMAAVENIINGIKTKDNIWAVNTEQEYHEEEKQE